MRTFINMNTHNIVHAYTCYHIRLLLIVVSAIIITQSALQ